MLIVADIHGYLDLLKKLLEHVHDDDIYLVGDLIDRGPNSYATLRYVMEHKELKPVLGNHDAELRDYLQAIDNDEKPRNANYYYLEDEFLFLSNKERKEILTFLNNLPYYYYLKDIDVLIAHAGVRSVEFLTLEQLLKVQTEEDFTWIREEFIYSDVISKLSTIFVVGHTPTGTIDNSNIYKVLRKSNRIFIDCCVFKTRRLAALQIKDNTLTTHYMNKYEDCTSSFGKLRR